MRTPPIPSNEEQRLKKLYQYQILDTLAESKFDFITKAVANICNSKIALISLVDKDRQWFKSKYGLAVNETPRDISFCGHAILGDEIFEISDAELDERFCDNPLFMNEPNVRFYAGMPLITSDNFRIGTLCVIDSAAKKLSSEQKDVLKAFALNVVELFELNLKNLTLDHLVREYKDVQEIVQAGAWELIVETGETIWSDQIYNIYKMPVGIPTNKTAGLSNYAEHERGKLTGLINLCITSHQSFDEIFEFYDNEGTKKWVRLIGKAIVNSKGKTTRVIGTFQDVTNLVDREKNLELVLSNVTEGYFDWHMKNEYEYISPRFWEILGYDYRDKKHHPSEWMKIVHPDDLENTLINLDLHIRTKGEHPFCSDLRYLNKEGAYHWIRCKGKVVEWDKNGEPVRLVGTHIDIHQERINTNEASIIIQGIESYAIVGRTDRFGVITYANDLFCQTSKYSRQELIGSNHRILNSGHHPKIFYKQMWDTILAKKIWRGEIKNIAKDRSVYWVDTTIIPLVSVMGEIEGFISFRYDITQRKLSEISLAESENKHKQLFMQSHDAVMILNPPDWFFSSCNKATLELFNVKDEEEFKKLGLWDLSPQLQPNGEASIELASKAIHKAVDEGSHYFEWTHQTIDGKPISCAVLLSRINEGHKIYLQATVRDISKETLLANKLTESNKYLDLALEGANLGIWDWYLTDNSIKFNERWASLRGAKLSELNMNLKDWESRVHPDDLPQAYENINNYLEGKSSYFEHIHRVKHKDGRWIYILGRGRFSQWDQTGKPVRFTGTDMDVTDLMSNRLKLDLFFKKAPYGFAFCDLHGTFIEINDELTRITGYSKEELNKISYWELTPEKFYTDEEAQLKILHEKGAYGPYLKEYKRKDGTIIPVSLSGFMVENYDGKIGIWSIVEDISEKSKLEAEKNELFSKYQAISLKLEAIFGLAPVVVYERQVDVNWTLKFTNNYIEKITGHSTHEFTDNQSISLSSRIHPDDREEIEKVINESINANSRYSINYRIIHKDGIVKWVWDQGSKAPNSNSLMGVLVDITERKSSEETTQLLSDVRSKFIELSNDKTKFFNYLLEKILNLSSSEYGFVGEILEDNTGKYLKTYALTDISWSEETKKFYQENAPKGLEFRNLDTLFGEVIRTGELLIANNAPTHPKASGIPKGHPPLSRFMGVPITYNGKIFAMIGVANNKDGYSLESYQALKPFFELVGEMIRSIKLTSELEAQKNFAFHNAKLASIGELAASVGHEINNPLAVIMGHLEMIKKFCDSKNIIYPEIDNKIAKSLHSVERISKIVKGLRAFSRMDGNTFQSVDISQLLIETKEMLADIYANNEVSIELDLHGPLLVNGNNGRLQQVFVNLFNNARDAVSDSEIKKIKVMAKTDGKMIELNFCDSGPGVPENIRDKIFDPFFTTKDVNKGTGIGLSLVATIVKEHGGELRLEDTKNKGACFVITLPSERRAWTQPYVLDNSLELAQFSGKVLIVDDEPDLCEILKYRLERYGLIIVTAPNGKVALDYLTNNINTIDLIISDIEMPVMNGLDLANAVRLSDQFKGGFIFITGSITGMPQNLKKVADDILTKPFNEKDILNIVNQWFSRKKNISSSQSE